MIERLLIRAPAWRLGAVAGVTGLLLLAWTGCQPRLGTAADVEKAIERGCNYRSQGLHQKAEQTFLRVLQVKPDSADAHLELGWLYFEHMKQYADALYHFERYARLQPKPRPGDPRSDILQQVKNTCKQEIAQEVPLGDLTLNLQRKQAVLVSSNVALLSSNQQLQLELAGLRRQLAQLQSRETARPTAQPDTVRTPEAAPTPQPAPPAQAAPPTDRVASGAHSPSSSTPSPAVQRPRTHEIRAGDTLYRLAKRYGVSEQAMRQANPTVDPTNMQIGDAVVIPNP